LDITRRKAKRSDRIAVPGLHISGWYDTYLKGSIDGFLALSKTAGTTFAREHQYLIAGPWQHIPWGDRIERRTLERRLCSTRMQSCCAGLNHWLKDSGEFNDEPRIRHFVLGRIAGARLKPFPQR